MNQQSAPDHATTVLLPQLDSVQHLEQPSPESSCLLSEVLTLDQLQELRSHLIRKNRLLGDLKRQLIEAQTFLAQLHCMTDRQVTTALKLHKESTGTGISFIDCAKGTMQELDSSSERMSYLIKQLQRESLATKF